MEKKSPDIWHSIDLSIVGILFQKQQYVVSSVKQELLFSTEIHKLTACQSPYEYTDGW